MRKRPNKPYSGFPLFAHAAGVWAKKIRGKLYYFGPRDDPNAALEKYLRERDYLQAGLADLTDKLTVADVLNLFLEEKKRRVETGDIADATYKEFEATCDVVAGIKHRQVETLTTADFNKLRETLADKMSVSDKIVVNAHSAHLHEATAAVVLTLGH